MRSHNTVNLAARCNPTAPRPSSCRRTLSSEKVRDIVGLYLNPTDRALVLCVDEKSQIQALDRTRPLLPLRPGQAERRTHITCARHHVPLRRSPGPVSHRRHRALEFRKFLDAIESGCPPSWTCT